MGTFGAFQVTRQQNFYIPRLRHNKTVSKKSELPSIKIENFKPTIGRTTLVYNRERTIVVGRQGKQKRFVVLQQKCILNLAGWHTRLSHKRSDPLVLPEAFMSSSQSQM